MRCCVCGKETGSQERHCDRCASLIQHKDRIKRRHALQKAYDSSADGFRCHWCGVLLEEEDYTDPFHLCFDHFFPVKSSELVASSEIFNKMKYELGPEEFHKAIKELAAHRAGKPFDKDVVEFRYWGLKAPSPSEVDEALHPYEITKVVVDECAICGRPPRKWSKFCPRCRRFVRMHRHAYHHNVKAMKEAYSEDEDAFICHYTGVKLDDESRSPWFLSFDHAVPGDEGTIVVAAYWINQMKNALNGEEFWKVVGEYDRYLREGGEFDRDVVGFRYWRRARGKRG